MSQTNNTTTEILCRSHFSNFDRDQINIMCFASSYIKRQSYSPINYSQELQIKNK